MLLYSKRKFFRMSGNFSRNRTFSTLFFNASVELIRHRSCDYSIGHAPVTRGTMAFDYEVPIGVKEII